MNLTSLLVCSDQRSVRVLSGVLGELEIDVEHCPDHKGAAKELGQRSFGAVIIDCDDERSFTLLKSLRAGRHNSKSMAIAIIETQTNSQEAFKLGANFVVFKPLSTEKVKSSFRAARALMKRERRRSVRLQVRIDAYFRFQNGEGEQVSIISLSEGGMAVRFGGMPGKKSGPIRFSFALPDTTTVLEGSATVAWQDARNHAGIQFANLPEASRESLKEWLRLQSGEKHDPPISCSLQSLTFGGCFLLTQSPFPSQTRVELLLRSADKSVKTEGKVLFMDPELGMGVEFLPRSAQRRERLDNLIRQMIANSDAIADVLVEPEGIDWSDPSTTSPAAHPSPQNFQSPDPLVELFRAGASFPKPQFLAQLEKYRLAVSSPQLPELATEALSYHRREPRIAVSLPVQVRTPDHKEPPPQQTRYLDVSHHGARIGGVAFHLKAGEVVNLVSDGCEARFLVIWVGEPGSAQEGQIGLQTLANE